MVLTTRPGLASQFRAWRWSMSSDRDHRRRFHHPVRRTTFVSAGAALALALIPAAAPLAGQGQPSVPAPPAVVFDGATVVDVEHGSLLGAQRIVTVGNRIQTLGPAHTVQIPQGA